jgi:hypothetical protein
VRAMPLRHAWVIVAPTGIALIVGRFQRVISSPRAKTI